VCLNYLQTLTVNFDLDDIIKTYQADLEKLGCPPYKSIRIVEITPDVIKRSPDKRVLEVYESEISPIAAFRHRHFELCSTFTWLNFCYGGIVDDCLLVTVEREVNTPALNPEAVEKLKKNGPRISLSEPPVIDEDYRWDKRAIKIVDKV
jgi:hypothetical protein